MELRRNDLHSAIVFAPCEWPDVYDKEEGNDITYNDPCLSHHS